MKINNVSGLRWIPICECERLMKDGQEVVVLTNNGYVAFDVVIRDEYGIRLASGYDLYRQIVGWMPQKTRVFDKLRACSEDYRTKAR